MIRKTQLQQLLSCKQHVRCSNDHERITQALMKNEHEACPIPDEVQLRLQFGPATLSYFPRTKKNAIAASTTDNEVF